MHGKVLSVPSKVKSPGTMLVELVKEHKAFSIVMGTRGLSTVKKMLKGSVSDHVFENADVPVIVVRMQND
jgi:nucleotide-binding universal stress UspA family protein